VKAELELRRVWFDEDGPHAEVHLSPVDFRGWMGSRSLYLDLHAPATLEFELVKHVRVSLAESDDGMNAP
jgi:hypothetical protein